MNHPPALRAPCALALALLLAGGAWAGTPAGLEVLARFPAGGVLRGQRPAALAVEIHNPQDAFEAVLHYAPHGDATMRRLPLKVPGRSRRLHMVPFFPGSPGPLKGRLSLTDAALAPLAPEQEVTGVVSGLRCVLGVASRDRETGVRPLLAHPDWRAQNLLTSFSAGDLPPCWEGLAPLDVLFVWGDDFQGLDAAVRGALREWVLQGGVVVALPGTDARSWEGSFVSLALDLELGAWTEETGSDGLRRYSYRSDVDQGHLGGFRRVEARARRGETKVSQGRGLLDDLASLAPLGRGWVVFVSFDPDQPGIRDWAGLPFLWARLLASWLSVEALEGGESYWTESDYVVSAVLKRESKSLPSVFLVGLAVLAYGILIGPVEYLAWRRAGRPHWSLISFPVLVVLCAGVALWATGRVRGQEVIQSEVAVEDVDPFTGDVVMETNVGLYSPSPGRFRLDGGPVNFLYEFRPDAATAAGQSELPCVLGPGGALETRVPVGGIRYFRSTRFESPDRRPVTVRIEKADYFKDETSSPLSEYMVQVTNDLPVSLDRCAIFSGDLYPLGPRVLQLEGAVPAGTTRTFDTRTKTIVLASLSGTLARLERSWKGAAPDPRDVFEHLAFFKAPPGEQWQQEKERRGLHIGNRLRHEEEACFSAWAEGGPLAFTPEGFTPQTPLGLRWIRMRLETSALTVATHSGR